MRILKLWQALRQYAAEQQVIEERSDTRILKLRVPVFGGRLAPVIEERSDTRILKQRDRTILLLLMDVIEERSDTRILKRRGT